MLKTKECIAMLLAGGQGSRLGVLTKHLAKPAVPFGGKYRIIDFTLSNCINSGIDTVGVLTQYQPLLLNDYIGNGHPWGLNRNYGGVHILSPYTKSKTAEWYKGTANAIYQNIKFIDNYNPEYVVILSGDHIYKMDYSKMLAFHKEKQADCTIAVLDVPKEEASRFGIMNITDDNKIYEFEEKPSQPKSTKASMGVYIFTWDKLRKYLIEDEENAESSNDFGKNIIPAMLDAGENLYAYLFEGYWKDVGTIDSLWEANMDLLNDDLPMDLSDKKFKIFARNNSNPCTLIKDGAVVKNSLMSEGCTVEGNVNCSIISTNCEIKKGANILYSVIMSGGVVEEGATVQYAIVGENVVIKKGAVVGQLPSEYENTDDWGVCVVGNNRVIEENQKVKSKEMV